MQDDQAAAISHQQDTTIHAQQTTSDTICSTLIKPAQRAKVSKTSLKDLWKTFFSKERMRTFETSLETT